VILAVPLDDFDQTVEQMKAASQHFLKGDPAPYKACWSYTDDVTIMGALGAYEKVWEQVGARLDWVAARYRGGHGTFEPISMGMSGDLAYLIYLQIGEVHLAGREEFSPLALRVTDIFRREEGIWKIIHRHADPIMYKDHVHGGPSIGGPA
jgi:ketosteroid isomerase-like protein